MGSLGTCLHFSNEIRLSHVSLICEQMIFKLRYWFWLFYILYHLSIGLRRMEKVLQDISKERKQCLSTYLWLYLLQFYVWINFILWHTSSFFKCFPNWIFYWCIKLMKFTLNVLLKWRLQTHDENHVFLNPLLALLFLIYVWIVVACTY